MNKDQTKKDSENKDEKLVELSDSEANEITGGFKFHHHKENPTQVPMSEGG